MEYQRMGDILIETIYEGERYNIPYKEMGGWYGYIKGLSIFQKDAGNLEIQFHDAFSEYKIKNNVNGKVSNKEEERAREVAIDFANWMLKEGFNGLYNDKWVLETGAEQFDGNPSTSKELFELYLKSKK